MLKIVHSSDFHLEKTFEYSSLPIKFAEARRRDIWFTVEKLIQETIKKEADYLLLAGDLFEEEFFTRSDLSRLYSLLATTKATVLIIAGNHDPIREKSVYRKLEKPSNVHVFFDSSPAIYEDSKVCIHGISYPDSEFKKDFLGDIQINPKKYNILLIHSDIISPNSSYLPLDKDQLKKYGFDYVALGHIHKPTIVSERMVYPGSPEPLSFKEKGLHGALYIELSKEDIKYEFLDVSTSIYIEESITIDDSFNLYQTINAIKKIIEPHDKKVYLRILLEGDLSDPSILNPKALEDSLMNYCQYVEVLNHTRQEIDVDRVYELNKENIIGQFIKSMKEKDLNDPINKYALELGLKALLKRGIK